MLHAVLGLGLGPKTYTIWGILNEKENETAYTKLSERLFQMVEGPEVETSLASS